MLWGIDRSRENRVKFSKSERMEEMMAMSEPVGSGEN
jgi:hypothetical protein